MDYYLLFDFGGTRIKYAISDKEGTFVEKGSVETHQNDFTLFLNSLVEVYKQVKESYKIVGIAISSAGAVDSIHGIIYGFSSILCMHRFPIIKEISAAMDNLPVSIENDGNCAGLGEMWKGSGIGITDIAIVVCGSGIGGAVIKNGKIEKGNHFGGGEFGYIPIVQESGKINGWSNYSIVNIIRKYNEFTNQNLTGEELFDLSKTDKVAKEYVDNFYRHFALGCISIASAVDPEIIIVGGAVSNRPELVEEIDKKLKELCEHNDLFSHVDVKVVSSTCGNDANLYGALYHFLHNGIVQL